ncbi:MAG: hypothetical protein LKF81_11530 [Prevotella sp.]|jgi:hypothetical protein|nr:hypothetical protein [Prevotella sp.]
MSENVLTLKRELRAKKDELSFVIGNGFNNYAYARDSNYHCSWKELLDTAYKNITGKKLLSIVGLSFTEFYNLLEFRCYNQNKLKNNFLKPLRQLESNKVHSTLQDDLKRWNVPVLTTNFDRNLETGMERCMMPHPKYPHKRPMTAYYPWDRYYGMQSQNDPNPCKGFRIWHINGFLDFNQSIKLSLSDYIAQSDYAHKLIHGKPDGIDSFNGKNHNYWRGYNTWLHIIFNCSLCIFGLALDRDETFLRWLLIERKKYFLKYPDRVKSGWYIYPKRDCMEPGKRLYLEGVGLTLIQVDDYDEIYQDLI